MKMRTQMLVTRMRTEVPRVSLHYWGLGKRVHARSIPAAGYKLTQPSLMTVDNRQKTILEKSNQISAIKSKTLKHETLLQRVCTVKPVAYGVNFQPQQALNPKSQTFKP